MCRNSFKRYLILWLALCLSVSSLLSGCFPSGAGQTASGKHLSISHTEPVLSDPEFTDLSDLPSDTYDPVELIYQSPELPNGCEVTSLAMLLNSASYPVDHLDLYENYLPTQGFTYQGGQRLGPSPEEYYVGDATSQSGGWYCFEGPIIQAGNAFLSDAGSDAQVVSVTGLSREELEDYALDGVPLAIWVTLGYADPAYASSFTWTLPDGSTYVLYSNLHCVVLSGMESGLFQVADPIYGENSIDPDVLWDCFESMGQRAILVELD